jgi:hypothetical protein
MILVYVAATFAPFLTFPRRTGAGIFVGTLPIGSGC